MRKSGKSNLSWLYARTQWGQRVGRSLLLLLSGIPVCGILQAQDPEPISRMWTFDAANGTAMPEEFRIARGDWEIIRDSEQSVMVQKAKSDDQVFNLLLQTTVLMQEVDLSVRVKANDGVVDQGGGLVWRAKNARTYYVARYNPLEDSLRVYKVVDGKRSQLGSAKVPGDRDWHTLRVEMRDVRLRCFLDGELKIEINDSAIRGWGRIGLWSKADAQTLFDDLKVTGTGMTDTSPAPPIDTKDFSVRNDRPYLDGNPVELWGLRCGNAFCSDAVTERYIRNFDNMNAHGINFVGAYIQGVNAGFPNSDAGLNGFTRHGRLLPEVARRIEWLVREADQRGMVVMLGVITPRKDQFFHTDEDIQAAIEETARFLKEKQLHNVFVNLCDEFDHPLTADKLLIREPDGERKKDQLTAWFKSIAPSIEVGVGPHWKSATADAYPTMDIRIIQKGMPIPADGFVVNVEPIRQDDYQNDGIFNATHVEAVFANCRNYLDAPNAVFMFHSGFVQGITNYSGTAPHAEMGGYGTGPTDRGIRFYYEWVRDNVGRWKYPHHVPASEFSIDPQGNP